MTGRMAGDERALPVWQMRKPVEVTKRRLTLPFEGYKTQGHRRVTRRKVVALLTTGGMIAASTTFAIHLIDDLFDQQGQNTIANSQQAQVNVANLAKNAAVNFVNPADGRAIVLVHLINGNFVAYDRHCTHRGVLVTYDPAKQLFVCSAHGATFNPAQAGAVVQGVPQEPPIKPLPKVAVQISADGLIIAK